MNIQAQLSASDKDVPVTLAILSLVHMLKSAETMFMHEDIARKNLKLPPKLDRISRCRVLALTEYGDVLPAVGLPLNDYTLMSLLECPIPVEVDETPPSELAKQWVFNPRRGWFRKVATAAGV